MPYARRLSPVCSSRRQPTVRVMPKIKTRKGAAKRFRLTGSGKLMRRRAGHNHLLEHKTTNRKRKLAGVALVDKRDIRNVRLMLPNTH